MSCLRNFSVFVSCMFLFIIQPGHGSEIVGGKEVEPHSLPFMAYVESELSTCGGTLIHPQWVLTAAHCTHMTIVTLGVHSIRKEESGSRQVREVEKRFRHPGYNGVTNDLMLLKLKEPVMLTKTVKCLPLGNTVKEPPAGSKCMVAGWGLTESNQPSDVLMSANVTVIDRETCSDNYNHHPVITSDMICAGSTGKEKVDVCSGDSGGPLLCNGVLIGVTSFGKKCESKENVPGVYAFVSNKQLNWIKETMKSYEMP